MKTFVILTILIGTLNLYSQNVSVTDYDVPVSSAKSFWIDGTYNWNQTSNDSSTTVKVNNANLNGLFRYFYSSLPFAWFLDVDATGQKYFSRYAHNIRIVPRIRKYIWDDEDLFAFSSMSIRHANSFSQLSSDLTVGAGYGRYINATALAKAVRIEEHLMREKVFPNHLPKETMIKIANIIEREGEYRDKYGDTYETNWYEDIEKEIVASGVTNGKGIGAIGLLRTQQVLKGINEIVNYKYFGWDVFAGVLFQLTTFDKSDPSAPSLSIGGRYSYPLSWRTQFNFRTDANTPMNENFFKDYFARANADFIYELSNRINFVASYRFDYIKQLVFDAYTKHNVNTSFVFYLENNIYLGINAFVIKNGQINQTDLGSSITLQYRLF